MADAEKQPRIEWIGPCDVSADQLSAPPDAAEQAGALKDAVDWRRERLQTGPTVAADLYRDSQEQGIAPRTLRRARTTLGVAGGRTWQLTASNADARAGKVGDS